MKNSCKFLKKIIKLNRNSWSNKKIITQYLGTVRSQFLLKNYIFVAETV